MSPVMMQQVVSAIPPLERYEIFVTLGRPDSWCWDDVTDADIVNMYLKSFSDRSIDRTRHLFTTFHQVSRILESAFAYNSIVSRIVNCHFNGDNASGWINNWIFQAHSPDIAMKIRNDTIRLLTMMVGKADMRPRYAP